MPTHIRANGTKVTCSSIVRNSWKFEKKDRRCFPNFIRLLMLRTNLIQSVVWYILQDV